MSTNSPPDCGKRGRTGCRSLLWELVLHTANTNLAQESSSYRLDAQGPSELVWMPCHPALSDGNPNTKNLQCACMVEGKALGKEGNYSPHPEKREGRVGNQVLTPMFQVIPDFTTLEAWVP